MSSYRHHDAPCRSPAKFVTSFGGLSVICGYLITLFTHLVRFFLCFITSLAMLNPNKDTMLAFVKFETFLDRAP